MGSRGVFDRPGMPEAPVAVISDAPELIVGDKVLDTSYDVVKEVAANINKIEELNQSIWNIHHIIPIIDEITISGSGGVAGGGTLINYPNLYLDFTNLTPLAEAVDLVKDLIAVQDESSGSVKSMNLSTFKTVVTADVNTAIDVVQDALDALGSDMDAGFLNLVSQFNTSISDAIAGVNSTIDDLDLRVIGLGSSADSLQTSVNSLNSSVNTLTSLNTSLAEDVSSILGSVADLQSHATVQDNEIDAIGVSLGEKASAEALSDLDVRVTAAEGELIAQSTRIDTLTSAVDDKAEASALDLLSTRVETAEGVNLAQAGAITYLNATVDGKADASALTSLTTRVTEAEDALEVQAGQLTSLTLTVDGKADASAVSSLASRVTDTENALVSQGAAITGLENSLDDKASASALETLTTRVSDVEGVNAAQSTAITNLAADVVGKASAGALDALTVRVTNAEGVNSSQATAITNLTAGLSGKADATALDTLTTRVTETEGVANSKAKVFRQNNAPTAGMSTGDLWFDANDSNKPYRYSGSEWVLIEDGRVPTLVTDVAANSSAITSLNTQIATKASASALTALSTTVSEIDGEVSSLASAITDISAGTVDGDVASARVRISASSTPSGWDARYSIRVKGGSGDSFQVAGIHFDVKSSTGQSRVVLVADKFVVQDGTTEEQPFIVSGGLVRLNNVRIDGGLITGIKSISADHIDATSMDLSEAYIGTLQVDTINIKKGAISRFGSMDTKSVPRVWFEERAGKTPKSVNWSGSNEGTLYKEELVLLTKTFALEGSARVSILGTIPFFVDAYNDGGLSAGKSSYDATVILEVKPSTKDWSEKKYVKKIASFRRKDEADGQADLRSGGSVNSVFAYHIPKGNYLNWDYRVRLVAMHRAGDGNEIRFFKVTAGASLDISWNTR